MDRNCNRKIRKQKELLEYLGKEESGVLQSYLNEICWKDETNREGHAAKVYFNALFGLSFTRTEDSLVNAALNYGYSIILSAFTRKLLQEAISHSWDCSMIICLISLILLQI